MAEQGFYKSAFEAAVEELSRLTSEYQSLVDQEVALEDRMEKVRRGAVSLATLADLDFDEIQEKYPDLFAGQPDPRVGITDAVRSVLRSTDKMLTPIEIRDGVFKINPAIAGHKNPLASIHAVLRRLLDANQIIIASNSEGASYGWVDCDDWEERVDNWVSNPEETKNGVRTRAKAKSKGKTK